MNSSSDPLLLAKYFLENLSDAWDADNFCKDLVHRLHSNHGTVSCFLTKLDNEAKVRWVGRYGYDVDASDMAQVSVWEQSASARAILTGECVAIASPKEYERHFGEGRLELQNGIGLLAIPIKNQNKSIGSLGLGFAKEIDDSILDDKIFEIVAIGAGAFLRRLSPKKLDKSQNFDIPDATRITSRDSQILNLMSEGFTHSEIGRVLNLSESSIKQTASQLYKKLGESNKSDAIDQAKRLKLI